MALRVKLLSGAALLLALGAAPPALAADLAADPAPAGGVAEVVVTAQRLNAARDSIQPQTGASTYTLTNQSIQAMPGGVNLQLSQVILQAPGVAQDSFGQLHVRGDHNGLQYRLNGVILPEGLSVFGQALNPRLAEQVELITGALPAQYGLRTAGIIDIRTKSGLETGGDVSVYGGSHDTWHPSGEYSASSGNLSMFVSTDYLRSVLGVESPDGKSDPLHDNTEQLHGFGYFEDIIDASNKLSAIVGTSSERFQIPNLPGQQPGLGLTVNGQSDFASQQLNEQQRETTQYGVLSILHTADKWTGQASLFARYSTLDFSPDAVGDLLYNGISQTAAKRDTAGGLQAEGVYTLTDAHTLRAGLLLQIDRSTSATSSLVLPVDGNGAQTSGAPLAIVDDGARTATTSSLYLQDEWKLLSNLVLNYGLRFDQFDGYRSENQLSPRVNLVWTPAGGTTVHLGYSRYFTPPPFELVASQTVGKFAGTTAASPSTLDTTPYAERSNYYDVGVTQKVMAGLTLGLDTYYKSSQHLIDEGQFGAPIILTPFNYQSGRTYGAELTGSYANGPFSAYANLAYSKAQGEDIVSSQFSFDPADLAYIKTHYIYLDHDQTYTATGGASWRLGATRVSADVIYGSGLRADGDVPNGRELAPYTQVNLSVSHSFEHLTPGGPTEVRLDLINVADAVYEIRDGTGVGVGAPQFGPRRGLFAGVTKTF
jgi:outer membrane receptor for ferrienterochelin and colicins